jgi:hypothetical protein
VQHVTVGGGGQAFVSNVTPKPSQAPSVSPPRQLERYGDVCNLIDPLATWIKNALLSPPPSRHLAAGAVGKVDLSSAALSAAHAGAHRGPRRSYR